MKFAVLMWCAFLVSACSDMGSARPSSKPESFITSDTTISQRAESEFEESAGTMILEFDAKGNWMKITSRGSAELTDDTPASRETALMIATMRAKRTVTEFLSNDVKSAKTLTRIARSYARKFQSADSSSTDQEGADDSETTSEASLDVRVNPNEKDRQAQRFASLLTERIQDSSSAIIKGAYVSSRRFENRRVTVELSTSRNSIGAARQLSRMMTGTL